MAEVPYLPSDVNSKTRIITQYKIIAGRNGVGDRNRTGHIFVQFFEDSIIISVQISFINNHWKFYKWKNFGNITWYQVGNVKIG